MPNSPVVLLYGETLNAGTRLAQWAAAVANVNINFIAAGTQVRVPTLIHGDLKMTESRAIAAYLLRLGKEGQVKHTLDARTQAVVDEWVEYEATCMHGRVQRVGDSPGGKERLQESMEYLESRLKEHCAEHKYLAGPVATLADLVVANCLSTTPVGPHYPYTREWLDRVETLVAGLSA